MKKKSLKENRIALGAGLGSTMQKEGPSSGEK